MFIKILWIGCTLQLAQAACEEASTGASKCAVGKCNVWLSGTKYCSQCVTPAEYLINGSCSDANTEDACASGQPTDGTCKSCKTGYFLYEGGCYKLNEVPGNFVCSETSAGSTAGVCGECKVANGFFKNPDTAAKQSCIACNRTESMGLVVGVADCSLCIAPSVEGATSPKAVVCTKCDTTATKYLKKADDGTTTCVADGQCDVSGSAYYKVDDSSNGKKCISCSDAAGITDAAGETWKGVTGCAKCTKPADINTATACDECSSGYTLEGGKCTSSSANRSGLSTGAIAGISVAVIVVVGGLVGFLCWWFICRGKA